MRLDFKKEYLFVLTGLLLIGFVFLVIQIIKASPAVPNPGHAWAEIEKPADCPAGEYIYGINGSTLDCSTPPGGGTLSCTEVSVSGKGSVSAYCSSGYTITGGGCRVTTVGKWVQACRRTSNGWTVCCGSTNEWCDDQCDVYVYARCCKVE